MLMVKYLTYKIQITHCAVKKNNWIHKRWQILLPLLVLSPTNDCECANPAMIISFTNACASIVGHKTNNGTEILYGKIAALLKDKTAYKNVSIITSFTVGGEERKLFFSRYN